MYKKLKTLSFTGPEKSVTKTFIREKEKRTNKGNDKHEDADSLSQYKKSFLMFVPNFKILGAVVPKKSLTKSVIGEKEKWTNKGNDTYMYKDVDSLRNNTRSRI